VSKRVLGPLALHPDGAAALVAEDGRLALDLWHRHGRELAAALDTVGLALLGYGLLALPLAAVLPAALGARRPVGIPRALAVALRRAPQLVALAMLAAAGYVVAGLVTIVGAYFAARIAVAWVDPRPALLTLLTAMLPGLALGYAVHVAHDFARASLVFEPVGAVGAARQALARLAREPGATLGAYGLVVAFGVLLFVGESLTSFATGGDTGARLAGLLVVQQCALFARVSARALWIAHVTRRWREPAA
jgi:hypothetical protein